MKHARSDYNRIQDSAAAGDPRIAGAVIDFIAFLTTRPGALVLGAEHEAPPAMEALTEWADLRGLSLEEPLVHDWNEPGGIPADEPVFLLRAKDRLAPDTVRYWANGLALEGGDERTIEMARDHSFSMEEYAAEHYDGGKLPDA